ncbi:heavy metal translocating P-type ATPase [Ochrobactrum sp. MYb15]|uniref:heavy metal translocating P-type ATPase n=1 Tax=Brucella TaxID=234 RepID=UPI0004AC6F4D|nr:heavy metal translocating P-type ATPase [Brucella rhizosphaerae]PQZ48861.1 heavy metal translocating P-type ATPase [Ochrobactrum sp. MYb19]PRA67321.1 heavy metal translocating P-type ATPase [Ochrobactrum sp. MYb18]PRA77719.1 heavy metal translocating P-type ATPase [Brucella thiophenivorans]PRA92331.1 heavy metal translocating P-type ATPase [Ochrobactrum sp. MYb14]PRA99729.1 heavy metal translocating P-type ATPase [Ochrobactrum sp. MYb15]
MNEVLKQNRFRVEGMDCASCATKIDTAVRRVAGVEDVSVSVTTGMMTVRHDGSSDLESVAKKVRSLGYSVEPVADEKAPAKREHHDHDHAGCSGHDHDHDHDHDHKHHDHSHEETEAKQIATGANSFRFQVDGMDCASCAAKIDTAVRRVGGVQDVSVSVTNGTMTVNHDGSANPDEIAAKVTGLGYKASAKSAATRTSKSIAPAKPKRWWQSSKGQMMLACGGGLVVAYIVGHLYPPIALWAFTAAMLIGLIPIAKRAYSAAINGTPFSIEMLMTIAAIGAVIIGATEEAAAVVFLFLVGELLEGVAAGKARASIQSLTALVPKTAFLESNGSTREVPAEDLNVGDVISVRPGDRMPADGEIISGESAVDEAPVTGESTPVGKDVGDSVFAGTINGDGLLRVKVTAAAQDNTIARVVRLVEEAQEAKAPTERFINRFSTYYTPGVVVVAALVAILPPLVAGAAWDEWIYKGLAILLIGCPCALVISTPAAIAASLSAGARRGLLLKGGAVLETIGKITTACFDKTGTLTEGKPQVTDVLPAALSEEDVLRLAASLDAGSSHPLALAIVGAAEARDLKLSEVSTGKAHGGKGVSGTANGIELFLGSRKAANEISAIPDELAARIAACNDEGKTVSVLVADGKIAGAIAMRDEPRADAIAGLKTLKDAGIRTVMLTGDNRRTAEAIGKDLGIEVRAELLPEDKQRIVGEFRNAGQVVAKVGDGINDAPALAAADVGIAMGGGTDVALETADAAVLHGRVGDVAAMVDLSQRTMRNIHQNITIALGLKAVFLVTTVLGITGLWPAILADTGATVLVTINALRLLRQPG